jgi:ABC-type dipeptide/oligopeptide/nickel transport system ATPase component
MFFAGFGRHGKTWEEGQGTARDGRVKKKPPCSGGGRPAVRYFLYLWPMPVNQDKGTKFLEAALRYARRGFRVIPLRERGKEPLISGWPERATWDEAQIREWWERWPNANIGIATGKYRDGYFCVLDFDPRHGGDWYDDVGEDTLPTTWVVHTGGDGRHFYYRTRDPLRCAKLRDGVDLKSEGGYVVVPPSVHPETGNEYGWRIGSAPRDLEMAWVPEWVLEELSVAGRVGEGGKEGMRLSLWRLAPPIPKGTRHNYLVSLAGVLWGAGVKEKELEAVLWGVLELFETREDFDPEVEIGGIMKGLKNWEGEKLDLGVVVRSLPEAVRAIVLREVSEAVGAMREAEERFLDGMRERAEELLRNLEVRMEGGAKAWGVYRDAEGKERVVPYTAEGLEKFLREQGIRLGRKTLRRLLRGLGVDVEADVMRAKQRRRRAELEEVEEVLMSYKWVEWQNEIWVVDGHRLVPTRATSIQNLLLRHGIDIGKERLEKVLVGVLDNIPVEQLNGIVLVDGPKYGRVGGIEGIWLRRGGTLYVVMPDGGLQFPFGKWPKGVYVLHNRDKDTLPNWNGTIDDLLAYWEGISSRLVIDQRVALAMLLPSLLDQAHIGLILKGPAGSGKSTLLRAIAYLRLGRRSKSSQGMNMRDYMAVLNKKAMVFYDETSYIPNDLQTALKSMITGDGIEMRALYSNKETAENEMFGTVVFCTTKLENLQPDLRARCFVWELENKGGGEYEGEILAFCAALWRRALAGAIKLYQQAAKLPPPPRHFMPEIRFRDWLSWAYRYAQVLGVKDRFVAQVRRAKIAAHRGEKFEFLIDALSSPNFVPQKEYTIKELIELAEPVGQDLSSIGRSLNSESVRDAMATLALSLGYFLRFEKKRLKGENKPKLRFIFTPIRVEISERLQGILRERSVDPDREDEGGLLPEEYFVGADADGGGTLTSFSSSQQSVSSESCLQGDSLEESEIRTPQKNDEDPTPSENGNKALDSKSVARVFMMEVLGVKARLYQNQITLSDAIREVEKMIECWESQLAEMGYTKAIGILREALGELHELRRFSKFGQGKI